MADPWGGKPGPNWKMVGPKAREKLSPLIRHYMKQAHPFTSCFTGDTPVDGPRDMEAFPEGIPISQLRPGDWVWSYDEAGRRFKLKRVTAAAITRYNAELVAVTLDHGKVLRCTPDHLFLRRDRTWVEAVRLRAGESLMPLYRDFEPRVRLYPDRPGYTPEHDVVAEALHGSLDGRHVHHGDRRRANLSPENIRALTGSEHASAHHAEFEEAVALRGECWLCPSCEELYTPTRYNQRRCDPCQLLRGYQKRVVGREETCPVCRGTFTLRAPNQRYCSRSCRWKAGGLAKAGKLERPWIEVHGHGVRDWNHKVVSVHRLTEQEDTWDIEVEDLHTFVVQGVVVHNCVRDNTKRFGGERAEKVCAVLKDLGHGGTGWRKGRKKGPVTEGDVENVLVALARAGLREEDVPLLEAYLEAEDPEGIQELRETERAVAEAVAELSVREEWSDAARKAAAAKRRARIGSPPPGSQRQVTIQHSSVDPKDMTDEELMSALNSFHPRSEEIREEILRRRARSSAGRSHASA